MNRHTAGLIIFFFLFAFHAGAPARAVGEKKAEKVLKGIGFGYSAETYLFPKKPANRDLDLETRNYFIGKEDGTKFHYGRNDTEVSQSGPTRWFAAPVHSEEYGVELATRFATKPRTTLSIGFGRRRIESDTFKDRWYVEQPAPPIPWICRPDNLCEDTLWWAPVTSNPFSVGISVKPGGNLRVDLKMRREKLELQPPAMASENVRLYSLDLSRKWRRLEAGILTEKLTAGSAPSNTHIEARAAYDFWKGAKISMEAGYYSSGLPLMGHPLADLGAKFIFEYLGGNEKFTPMYTEKIGYYSLGIGYVYEFD